MVDPNIPDQLIAWAKTELRDLPWRRTRDPWLVLVSEVMLQQTQVSRVLDRYDVFISRFPTVESCAHAPSAAVIELWAGLGYNRRAVNLWRAAGVVVEEHDGSFPEDLDGLLALPGVGPYTARALLAFAFEHDVGVLDTNVGRLLARWSGHTLTPTQAQTQADALVPPGQGWTWNQSLFDFAVAVCTKREPACIDCPLANNCAWNGLGADPAINSAAVSGRQSTFDGSERQVRGRIVAALRQGPVADDELVRLGRSSDSAADLERIVAGLIADGLAQKSGTLLQLPT